MSQERNPDEWRPPEQRRPRRIDSDGEDSSFPIAWVLIGGLAGLLTIGLIGLGVANILRKHDVTPTPVVLPTLALTTPELTPTPFIAATEETPPTVAPPTATPVPPESPLPTPTVEIVLPTEIGIGGHVKVSNTEGNGISMRAGPGTNNTRLRTADEGLILEVLNGPREDEQGEVYVWWFLRATDDGTEGWCAQGNPADGTQWLVPSLPPE